MKVFLGSDHGGWHQAKQLQENLESLGHQVINCSNEEYDPADDYPPIAFKVAQEVAALQNAGEQARGILICKSSGGVVIAANKVDGIRAVSVFSVEQVARAVAHDHANIIGLASLFTSSDEMVKLATFFLEQSWDLHERHIRRVGQITEFERQKR